MYKNMFLCTYEPTNTLCIIDTCRDAVHQLAIPDLMRSDLLECLFQQQMTVPTHRNSWERFRLDLAGAFAQLFSPAVMQALPSCPLELPVSLLIKDIAMREYDFSVSVNSQGAPSLALSDLSCLSCCIVLHDL